MNPRRLISAIFLIVLSLTTVASGQESAFDRALKRLSGLDGKAFSLAVDSIYLALDPLTDYRLKTEVTRKLFSITEGKDEVAHIRSLCYLVIYSDTSRPGLFDEAYHLAQRNHRLDLMDFVEDRRSRYYISQKKYDSAIVHILKMRDIYRSDKNDETYRNILHLLGDVYYNTRLYPQAEEAYHDLYVKISQSGSWNFWRPYVIMNNLGQIALQSKNYPLALFWFEKSLRMAREHLHASYKDNIVAYCHIKIAETFLKTGKPDEAGKELSYVGEIPEDHIFEDVRQELMFMQGRLLLQRGRYDEALAVAMKLKPGDSLIFSNYRFVPEVYNLLSAIHAGKRQFQTAYWYLGQYAAANDSLESQGMRARSMVILSEKNHELTKKDLVISTQQNKGLVVFAVFLLLSFLSLLFLYRRLYRSKLALVRLSLENQGQPEPKTGLKSEPLKEDFHEDEKIILLASLLKDLMEKEKPWLDPVLNIQQVSGLLHTNRNYLSKAINDCLKTNFPGLINEYRIRESIRLITEGYTIHHTQEALAKQCGFASRTVFINAFKKHTGVTPSFFIANYKNPESHSKTPSEND